MAKISIEAVVARYQDAFGFVGGNLSNAAFGRFVKLPVYGDAYQVNDVSFANIVLINTKTGKRYAFGISDPDSPSEFIGPPLMVSFSRGKNVVRTAIDRAETEVIEHFGLKPWSINIQGILIDTDNRQYPGDLIRKVNEMFSAYGTFRVESDIFLDLDITEVFFDDDFQVGFVEGYVDTVKFSVRAISVLPVEIRTKG